ncbi:hypothetical protein JCM25156A_29590 [Komagataeibacter kakiaceti JCM 25156]
MATPSSVGFVLIWQADQKEVWMDNLMVQTVESSIFCVCSNALGTLTFKKIIYHTI